MKEYIFLNCVCMHTHGNLTIGVITPALTDWVAIFYILSTAPSGEVRSTYKDKTKLTSQCPVPVHACLYDQAPHLFCEAEYLEQDFPSQAQYGSLARQQSAQASPYTSQRWRAR